MVWISEGLLHLQLVGKRWFDKNLLSLSLYFFQFRFPFRKYLLVGDRRFRVIQSYYNGQFRPTKRNM